MDTTYTSSGGDLVREARIEQLLDDALEGTFPASDPIAITVGQPHEAGFMNGSVS